MKNVNYHNPYRNNPHDSEHEHCMCIFNAGSNIQCVHNMFGNASWRNTIQHNSVSIPQIPASSKRFATEMQRKTVRQIPNTLALQQHYAAISCKI
jgi:hypothetical protein